MKQIYFVVVMLLILFSPTKTFAQSTTRNVVNIYFFWEESCEHCLNEREFLVRLANDRQGILVHEFNLTERGNQEILYAISQEYKISFDVVPVTFMGDEYMIGFESPETTGQDIINLADILQKNGDPDEIGNFIFAKESQLANPISNSLDAQNPKKHPVDIFLDKFKADFILGVMLLGVALWIIVPKLRKKKA